MGIILSEISQAKANTVWYSLYISKKTQPPSEYNKKEIGTDLGNKLVITNGERQGQGTF